MLPSPPPLSAQDFTIEQYILLMLNDGLRPFLARWHPRLSFWRGLQMPESLWPLESLCRADLEATRQRMLIYTWGLGSILHVPQLEAILKQPPPAVLPVLNDEHVVEQQEQSLLWRCSGGHRKAAWRIFVEIVSRIATRPLESGTGTLKAALSSLYRLYDVVRTELKEAGPTPSLRSATAAVAAEPDTAVEMIALHILNGPLRRFLAHWHPIVDQHEKANEPEAQWPEQQAERCRRELEATRQAILDDARRLGALIGVQHLDILLAA